MKNHFIGKWNFVKSEGGFRIKLELTIPVGRNLQSSSPT